MKQTEQQIYITPCAIEVLSFKIADPLVHVASGSLSCLWQPLHLEILSAPTPSLPRLIVPQFPYNNAFNESSTPIIEIEIPDPVLLA